MQMNLNLLCSYDVLRFRHYNTDNNVRHTDGICALPNRTRDLPYANPTCDLSHADATTDIPHAKTNYSFWIRNSKCVLSRFCA